jgi:hypothetical protein
VVEVPVSMLWARSKNNLLVVVGCRVSGSGKPILFNRALERLTEENLNDPVDAITFVDREFIVAAFGSQLAVFQRPHVSSAYR